MSFALIFEPDAALEIIEAFQWCKEQSFGLDGEFLRSDMIERRYARSIQNFRN